MDKNKRHVENVILKATMLEIQKKKKIHTAIKHFTL